MEDKKPGYYAVIPAQVRYDPALRPNAKLLYGELNALAGADGYCWASDKYFASLFGLSAKTVNELVKSLERQGYIRIEMSSNARGPERHIYAGAFLVIPKNEDIRKNREDLPGGYPEKSGSANPDFSEAYNDNNITKINTTPIPPMAKKQLGLSPEILHRVMDYAGEDQQLLKALLDFAEKRQKRKKPIDTDRTLTLLLNRLDKLSGGERQMKLDLIDRAIECNWLSFFPLRDDETRPDIGGGYIPEVIDKW